MRHHSIAVYEAQHRAREERTEDDLEAEPLGKRQESHEQQERAADADLPGRVLESHQHSRHAAQPLGPDERGDEGCADEQEPTEQEDRPIG